MTNEELCEEIKSTIFATRMADSAFIEHTLDLLNGWLEVCPEDLKKIPLHRDTSDWAVYLQQELKLQRVHEEPL